MKATSVAGVLIAAVVCMEVGCASRSTEIRAVPVDRETYRPLACQALYDELEAVSGQAVSAAVAVDERFADNAALILVSGMVWPAALGLRGDGEQARRLGVLRGRHEALLEELSAKQCPPASMVANPGLAAELVVQPGDRYVYSGAGVAHVVLQARVTAVRNERIEMEEGRWAQDFAGNRLGVGPLHETRTLRLPDDFGPVAALPYVVDLLKPRLTIGQSLHGVVYPGGDAPALEVTGQVVAVGLARLQQESLPTVTIELEGRAIEPMAGNGTARRTVQGALVVDSRNGMLVRLQLQGSAASASTDTRLLRVERSNAGGAAPSTH
ncbi:MAG: hypothetical protein JWQ11_4368 [Rhizobacter sp.]|nr:hypothetical protein [Rhizobacter sp.]